MNVGAAAGQPALAAGSIEALAVTGGSGSGAKVVNFNHTGTSYTFAPNLTGSLRLEQNGGVSILTGSNSYTGPTLVSAGRLVAGGAVALSGGTSNAGYQLSGGVLDLNGYALTMSRLAGTGGTVEFGNASLTIQQETDSVFAGTLSGAGGLAKSGTGTLTLTGTSSYLGGTTISAGRLLAGSATGLRSGTSGADYQINGGTLDLNGYDLTVSSLLGNGAVALGTAELTVHQTGSSNFGGSITGAGGLIKQGAGTLALSGTNSYGGNTFVRDGTLVMTSSATLSGSIIAGIGSGDLGNLVVSGGNVVGPAVVAGGFAGSNGTVTVSGGILNAQLFEAGSFGTGSLQVNGGLIESVNGQIFLGRNASGVGTFTLSSGTVNNGGAPNSGFFAIGQAGQGSLTISGGSLTSVTTYVGVTGSGSATVSGGTWNTGNLFSSSAGGQGTLLIQGGLVSSSAVFLGYGGPSSATVTGGTWNSASLSLGA